MPDRIIRGELLESEGWLSLKDNADRICWIAAFLSADVFGDMPAGPQRLLRLWRFAGIDIPEKVAAVQQNLADVDLIRLYQVDAKPYLHIPKYNQQRRWLGHVWPLSPWASNEDIQRVTKKPHEDRREPPYGLGLEVEKGLSKIKGLKGLTPPRPVDNSPGKWWDTVETIKAKGLLFGIRPNPGESRDALYRRVDAAIKTAKEKTP